MAGLAIWVDISKLSKGKNLANFDNDDSTLNVFFNKTQKEPSHIRFGFGSLNEYEITQSIDKLFQTLSDVEP